MNDTRWWEHVDNVDTSPTDVSAHDHSKPVFVAQGCITDSDIDDLIARIKSSASAWLVAEEQWLPPLESYFRTELPRVNVLPCIKAEFLENVYQRFLWCQVTPYENWGSAAVLAVMSGGVQKMLSAFHSVGLGAAAAKSSISLQTITQPKRTKPLSLRLYLHHADASTSSDGDDPVGVDTSSAVEVALTLRGHLRYTQIRTFVLTADVAMAREISPVARAWFRIKHKYNVEINTGRVLRFVICRDELYKNNIHPGELVGIMQRCIPEAMQVIDTTEFGIIIWMAFPVKSIEEHATMVSVLHAAPSKTRRTEEEYRTRNRQLTSLFCLYREDDLLPHEWELLCRLRAPVDRTKDIVDLAELDTTTIPEEELSPLLALQYLSCVILPRLLDLRVGGVKDIVDYELCHTTPDKHVNKKYWFVVTTGSCLRDPRHTGDDVRKLGDIIPPYINHQRTVSTSVEQMQQVYGIEGLLQLFRAADDVNKQMLEVILQQASWFGRAWDGLSRGTVQEHCTGPLAKLSYEVPMQHIRESAQHNRVDYMESVASCILMGNPPPVGTGPVMMYIDPAAAPSAIPEDAATEEEERHRKRPRDYKDDLLREVLQA